MGIELTSTGIRGYSTASEESSQLERQTLNVDSILGSPGLPRPTNPVLQPRHTPPNTFRSICLVNLHLQRRDKSTRRRSTPDISFHVVPFSSAGKVDGA
jgi:hypothetical protein